MKNWIAFSSLLLLFLGCSQVEKKYTLKLKLLKLTPQTLYDEKLVADVLFDAQEDNVDSLKTKSRQLFLKGIEAYKNLKAPEKALPYFRSSALTFPDAKTYYELGNALLEVGGQENIKESIQAYKVTRYLGFQPLASVHYNEAKAHFMLYENPFVLDELGSNQENAKETELSESINALRNAFNEGFYDTTLLKTDEKIKNIVRYKDFQEMLIHATATRLKKDGNGLFSLYGKSYPRVGSTFVIDLPNVELANYNQAISYDFAPYIPEMENVGFGREVSNDFFYVAKISNTSNYTAVIYKSVSFYGESSQPVHTTLATYDSKGEVISKILLSCVCSANKVKTGKIEEGAVTIEEYKRNWKYPLDKIAMDDNEITSNDFITKATYRIDETGKIVEESVPQEFKDSTIRASNSDENEDKIQ